MKWIGQHIYDLASRFRNDVFLEDISTGTIASGAHLGLDSNNKIVKAVDGGGDLTSIVAGTGLSGTSLTGPIPTLSVDATQAGITGLGTITSGTWQSATAVIASQYLDGDTAHLTTDQTFTGNKTFDETIIGSINGSAATVATIDDLAPNTATTQATQPAIESIGTDGDTLSILSDTLLMSNTSADTPVIKLVNTTNDDQAGQLIFEKLRADDAVAQGQNLGEIWFRGQDANQNSQNYAYIVGEIDVSTHGQESGQLLLGIANHDGGFGGSGLVLTGGSQDVEVDVTVGLGANSVVTIPGNIDLAGDIDVDGTLEADAITLGGTALGSLYTTISATKQLTHHMIKDDIGTGVIYISLGELDAESGTKSNKNLPLLAPVEGKLLKIFLRTTEDMSGSGHDTNLTWRLLTRATSASTTGNAAVVGTQTGAGPTASSMVTYDFTSSLDSGTNAIAAGDKVLLSVQSDAASADSSFYITCLWEWDLS